jgi:phage host-nuclease inhibitor protein Gam
MYDEYRQVMKTATRAARERIEERWGVAGVEQRRLLRERSDRLALLEEKQIADCRKQNAELEREVSRLFERVQRWSSICNCDSDRVADQSESVPQESRLDSGAAR